MSGGSGEPPHDEDEGVGYRKTPKPTRFKPGQSGNPKGRPKGAKGKHHLHDAILQKARETLLEEGKRPISVREGEAVTTMDAYRLAVRAAFAAAAKGSAMAQRTVIQMTMTAEAEISGVMTAMFREMVQYKEDCARKRLQCSRAGLPEPSFPIDPDHFVLDWEKLTVEYVGPLAEQLNQSLKDRLRCRDEWAEDFQFCRERWEESAESTAGLVLMLQAQRNYDIISESLPPRYRRPLAGRVTNADIEAARARAGGDDQIQGSAGGP